MGNIFFKRKQGVILTPPPYGYQQQFGTFAQQNPSMVMQQKPVNQQPQPIPMQSQQQFQRISHFSNSTGPIVSSNSRKNDVLLSNLSGWSLDDIENLRQEFNMYANQNGIIDREAFCRLYVASLLHTTWETLQRDAESAFRSFDVNWTGAIDFNRYIITCSHMANDMQNGIRY
ncbi:unnamed protein product [Didymodactylos carnosus]|uniref:Uncharacterized protein n=1 Tax=Didymodactylos carnosus TaxID=1234261 RepID=A0A813U5V7_9BILA|nr:unnamed protein product [Didymodactylos carnosus]CAF1618256.1 unnamed protein product [Didymodactylos carnosus]CAF3607999.1 unnamed protein product [Didymodactylos carnosus]CAF4436135.1 unnamed protein product [Didymodactylos carnosus]